jgi:hypothetical protein
MYYFLAIAKKDCISIILTHNKETRHSVDR